MADATDLLIKAYIAKIISLNTGYSVWGRLVPSTENGDCYIQVSITGGNSEPGKMARIERYSVTVSIFSQNTAVDVDILADAIKSSICDDNRVCLIDTTPLKTSIVAYNFTNPDPLLFPEATFINRYMTFTHLIH